MRFNIGTCKISISFPLITVMVLLIYFDNTHTFLMGLFSAILHELGHIITMYICHTSPQELKLGLLDIAIVNNKSYRTYYQEIAVNIMGVIINILTFTFCLIIYIYINNDYILTFGIINLILALFNMLPSDELDGGKILSLIISHNFNDSMAEKVMFIISIIVVVILFVFGLYILINFNHNFTLLLCGIYLLIALVKSRKSI